jgi:2-C-methyl-D-erythritol 2,4-cyclodiphosphate synthase
MHLRVELLKVGIGYDIHRLVAGRPLILGGVTIPHTRGLEGHSDADVVLHAVIDAMLGAAGLGDIGLHFPPSDERYRGISSLQLLKRASVLVQAQGCEVVNIDVTVVAETPALRPHADEMRQNIEKVLDVDSSHINIKATTNEGMGPEGRQEAISAQAVVLLDKRP